MVQKWQIFFNGDWMTYIMQIRLKIQETSLDVTTNCEEIRKSIGLAIWSNHTD